MTCDSPPSTATVRSLLPLEERPGVISLLAGKPNAETYPITSMQFTLRDPVTNQEVPVSLTEKEVARALQYSGSAGIPELNDWLLGLQDHIHDRKQGEGWDLCFGTGSSDLLYKVLSPPYELVVSHPDVSTRWCSRSSGKAMLPSSKPLYTREY